VIEAAELPKSAGWAWQLKKEKVYKKMKKEIQYEGDSIRCINMWNKHFKKKGFQASLELPGKPRGEYKEPEDPEELRLWKLEEKRYKMVITPNAEKGGSVYSRSSSLVRSVSGEGAKLEDKAAMQSQLDKDEEDERPGEGE